MSWHDSYFLLMYDMFFKGRSMSSSEQQLKELLASVVASLYNIQTPPQITRTKQRQWGDFASNIAMLLTKELKLPPRDIAQTIAHELSKSDWIVKVDIAGPGFINIFLSNYTKVAIINHVRQAPSLITPTDSPQKVIIEFVSANPTGPLHVGHGRAAALGSTIANLYEAYGHQVHREYYVNDAGNQMNILALSVLLRYYALHHDFSLLPFGCYQGAYISDIARGIPTDKCSSDPSAFLHWLGTQESAIQEAFHSTQEHPATLEALRLSTQWLKDQEPAYAWLQSYALTNILDGIKKDLEDFRVRYDDYFYESSLVPDAVSQTLDRLAHLGLTETRDGALWFKASQVGDDKDRVLVRSNGEYTYFATDLAYHWHKSQRASHMLDLFGADHHGYCKRIQAGVNALNTDAVCDIRIYQFVTLLREGKKVGMSTRSGQFDTVRDVYDYCGVDAARFFYLMRSCDQHVEFDLDLAKSASQENPVYYVQYAHARICRILDKEPAPSQVNLTHLTQDLESDLCLHLEQYEKTISRCIDSHDPQPLCTYLLDLAKMFHSYYNHVPVLKAADDVRQARLALLDAIRHHIADGLALLGVSAPGQM